MGNTRQVFLVAIVALLFADFNAVYAQPPDDKELTSLSLEELMELNVTTVSKKSQKLQDAAAAIFVITKEDIRRSGATSLPEILRMVPGLDIGRVASGDWAVSSRGFVGVFADRLLTLIDGRTIFTPIFSGTFWDEEDLVLEDINRIEVIRGPGATLWGSNAVNGVINIITDSAAEAKGVTASAITGDEDKFIGAARYGGNVGNTAYKLYTKYSTRDDLELESGGEADDGWRSVRAGFRSDTAASKKDSITLDGEFFHLNKGLNLLAPSLTEPDLVEEEDIPRSGGGGHVMGRWTRQIEDDSDLSLQLYYNHSDRNDTVLESSIDIYDIDFQHRFSPIKQHELVWGSGYRFHSDHFESGNVSSVDPTSRSYDLITGFIQDDVTLIEGVWHLIVGTKIENNAYSGWEIQPTARTIVTPTESTAYWGAISRAVRSPARFNRDGTLQIAAVPTEAGVPGLVTLTGDANYDSGYLIAYELGARRELGNQFTGDLALFYNDYHNLDTSDAIEPFFSPDPVPHLEIPFKLADGGQGFTWGAEAALNYRPWSWWRLVTAYSFLQMEFNQPESDLIYGSLEHDSPQNQVHLRSLIDLPHNLEFDAAYRFVDTIETYDISAYSELDLRLGWRPLENLEISLVGQNLLHDTHPEFASNFVSAEQGEIERAFYGKVAFKY